MKAIFVVVVLALIAVVLSQTPTKPVWPNSFSASVVAHSNREPTRFFRWFYDFSVKKDRFDGLVRWRDEQYWAEIIFDHADKTEYAVFKQPGFDVCITNAINASMPHPTFTNVQYIGKAEINYVPANHWFERDAARGVTFQVFDAQDARRNILRIDFHEERTGRSGQWTFFEFDRAPNNKEIYEIPKAILEQCTRFGGMSALDLLTQAEW